MKRGKMGRVLTYMNARLLMPLALLLPFAMAQSDPPGRVARVSAAQGAVSMQSQATGQDWVPAQINFPLTTGDQLWTDMDGRAELHLGSAAIRLREETSASITVLDDQVLQIQLVSGGVSIRVRHLYPDEVFEVDTPNLAFTIRQPGEYRIEVVGQQTKVIVWSGAAQVFGDGRDFPLRARDYAVVNGFGQLSYTLMSAPPADDFDRWAQGRDRRPDADSLRYVSQDTIGAEDLDLYGSWSEVPDIGPVWSPRVNGGWAPYKVGHWAWIGPWGWTWIDDAPWGFAPFHYGRWVFVTGSWGWVPGQQGQRPVYSPALVAWAGGRGAGQAWFPLGPGDTYVPTHHASPAYLARINRGVIVNKINRPFVNQTAPGAVVGMTKADMEAGRRGASTVPRVSEVTAVAPVPASRPVMQRMPGTGPVARPPAALSRGVVARHGVPAAATVAAPARPAVETREAGTRFPGRESETVRPAQRMERPENADRPARRAAPAMEGTVVTPPPARPTERVERPENAERPARRAAPAVEGTLMTPQPTRPAERVERPENAERPARRVAPALEGTVVTPQPARPAERVERPAATPERPRPGVVPSERSQPTAERIDRPINAPAPVLSPQHHEVRPEPRREEKKEEKKDDKKDEKKK